MKVIINLKGYGTCKGKGYGILSTAPSGINKGNGRGKGTGQGRGKGKGRHAGFRKGVGTAARGKKDIIR